MKDLAHAYTEKMARKIGFKGIFNVQFVIYNDILYVLEVNPRASRTVPIISKITGVNLIDECVQILTGSSLKKDLQVEQTYYAIKNPIFSMGQVGWN